MAFLGLGLGALLTGLQYAPVLLNAGVSAYNAVTGGVNAAAAAAPQIGAAVDTGRQYLGVAGQGIGTRGQYLQQRLLTGLLDAGTSLVYRKIQQKARQSPNGHLWRLARQAVVDPTMQYAHRYAKRSIRDAVFQPAGWKKKIYDLADEVGTNFTFNPHKYDRHHGFAMTPQQQQQSLLRQQQRANWNEYQRTKFSRWGKMLTQHVPQIKPINYQFQNPSWLQKRLQQAERQRLLKQEAANASIMPPKSNKTRRIRKPNRLDKPVKFNYQTRSNM